MSTDDLRGRLAAWLEDDPDEALDLYFRQCSVSVDCSDLSLMAGTLANGGIIPTNRRPSPLSTG